jgi:hypothetical protein
LDIKSHLKFSTTSYRGTSYYTPHSPTISRDTFSTSLQTTPNSNIVHGTNGHMIVYSTSQPMSINNNQYYFGRDHYYHSYTYVHVGGGSSLHSSNRRMCAIPLEKYTQNTVPLVTSVPSNSTDDDMDNNSTSLFDAVKNDQSTTTTTTTTLPTTTISQASTTPNPAIHVSI